MVTDRPALVTDREDNIRFQDFRTHKTCRHCDGPVNWMYTRFGTKLPFDAELTPRGQDYDKTGWIPGMWPIQGSTSNMKRLVMAPALHYGREKLMRVTHVAMVHKCAQYLAAQQAGEAGA